MSILEIMSHIVFRNICRSILLSLRDTTTGDTTDRPTSTTDAYLPLRRAINNTDLTVLLPKSLTVIKVMVDHNYLCL